MNHQNHKLKWSQCTKNPIGLTPGDSINTDHLPGTDTMNTDGGLSTSERKKLILKTSLAGIAVNILISATKIIIGISVSSMAVISEGINNAADAGSSVLTFAGTKLAGKAPDEKHPFGYGRIEYLTSIVVGVMILIAGSEILQESVRAVLHPSEMNVSAVMLFAVAAAAAAKLALETFTVKVGRRTGAASLTAVGEESRHDALFSVLTIGSALLYLYKGIMLDGYISIFFSLTVIRIGVLTLKDAVSELLGRPGQKELADRLYAEIRKTDGIINAADMMLHNYGPDAWSGSVNIEVDHSHTIGEVYSFVHKLQLRIMHEYNVTMVFGIYAIDNDHEEIRCLRCCIAEFVRNYEHLKSYHALYFESDTGIIYCDFVVDYKLKDREQLDTDFKAYMAEHYPGHPVELTIETDYV